MTEPTALAYSIKEACSLSSLGRTSIYAAIARGDLKTKKIGRRTLIAAVDLKAWLDSCSAVSASPKSSREQSDALA
jgi:excisionase family DNA binding protein